jgi:hypothetical protein
MILAGKKGKNTVQAFVIFRNFWGEERSSVNQTNNDIKNARGVRRRWGSNAKDIVGQSQRRDLRCMQKSGEFVNTEWGSR